MSGTTPILGITEVAAAQNQKEVTINDGFVALENATQASFAVSFTANAASLSATQFTSAFHFQSTGSLTALGTLTVPNSTRDFQVFNTSTAYPIVVGGTTGAGVTIAADSLVQIYNDGTNCYAATAPASSGVTSVVGSGLVEVSTAAGAATVSLEAIGPGDLIGNTGTGSAAPSAVSLSALLDAGFAAAEGDILVRGSSVWAVLAPGTSGDVLTTGGAGALPAWEAPSGGGGGSGTVTEVVVASSAFLNGGTITGTGTISSPTLAAQSLIGNLGSIGAQPSAVAIGTGFTIVGGNTLEVSGGGGAGEWNAGTVTALGTNLSLSGGTLSASGSSGTVTDIVAGAGLTGGSITGSGTIALEASQMIRTVPFPIVGLPASSQQMNVTVTQAGTLLANGGTPQAYIPTHPAATQTLTLNTIHSGTITNQGTISISTSGSVTWPTFSNVSMAAGDTVQIVNQPTTDAAFANACLSLQFQVT